jgi:hypothetical protein
VTPRDPAHLDEPQQTPHAVHVERPGEDVVERDHRGVAAVADPGDAVRPALGPDRREPLRAGCGIGDHEVRRSHEVILDDLATGQLHLVSETSHELGCGCRTFLIAIDEQHALSRDHRFACEKRTRCRLRATNDHLSRRCRLYKRATFARPTCEHSRHSKNLRERARAIGS